MKPIETPVYYFNKLAGKVNGNEFKFLMFCHWWTSGIMKRRTHEASYETIQKFTGLERKAFDRVVDSLHKQSIISVKYHDKRDEKLERLLYPMPDDFYLFTLSRRHVKGKDGRDNGKEVLWEITNETIEAGSYAGNSAIQRTILLSWGNSPIQSLMIRQGKTGETMGFSKRHKQVSLGIGEFTLNDETLNEGSKTYYYRAYRI